LAVDTDLTVHEQQTAAWAKVGINTSRVDTMTEAISRLTHNSDYLFIAINEDTIDYLPELPMMREITALPIFVITSDYTTEKKIAAIKAGADVYDPFSKFTHENVIGALELLELPKRWLNREIKPASVLARSDIVISLTRRTVIVNHISVKLNKKEFEILQFLMTNSGIFVTPAKLIDKVWGNDTADNNALWQAVKRLRIKLAEVSPKEYIESERDTGYKFLG